MRLKTKRLIIRHLKDSDAGELSRLGNNKKISDNLTDLFPHPYTLKEAKNWIRKNDSKSTNYAITIKDKLIGAIGLSQYKDERSHIAEIGYWIGEEYWSNGYATEALKAVTEYAFKRFKIERIEAQVFIWNRKSARTLEKAGYQFEGTLRKNSIKKGKLVDDHIYSILKR